MRNAFGVTESATWPHTECVPAAAVTAPDHPEFSSMLRRKKFHRSGRHTFTGGIHTHCPLTVMRTTGFVPSESNAQPENRICFPLTEMSSTDASGGVPAGTHGGGTGSHGVGGGVGVGGAGVVVGGDQIVVVVVVTVGGTVLNAGTRVVVGAPGIVVVVGTAPGTRPDTFKRG